MPIQAGRTLHSATRASRASFSSCRASRRLLALLALSCTRALAASAAASFRAASANLQQKAAGVPSVLPHNYRLRLFPPIKYSSVQRSDTNRLYVMLTANHTPRCIWSVGSMAKDTYPEIIRTTARTFAFTTPVYYLLTNEWSWYHENPNPTFLSTRQCEP